MDVNRFFYRHLFHLTLKLRREWFYPYLHELERTQYASKLDIEMLQLKKLNAILAYASANIPHYKGSIPNSVRSLSELGTLPLLDKEMIRDHSESFMKKSGHMHRLKTSGGSTGAPVTLLKDNNGMAQEMAGTWRGYTWAGVHVGDRQARFWGIPTRTKDLFRSKLIDFVCNRMRVSAFGYDESKFDATLAEMGKFKPDYLYGYVSSINDLAEYMLENDISIPSPVSAVITTAEVLSETDRKRIASAFQAKVFNEYGCGEIGTIAHECEQGSLHITSENVIVEIIRKDGLPAIPGESGEIVVTDLTNYSMPLIRYRLKDWGVVSSDLCSCGRGLPVLESIFGREYDSLVSRDYRKFHGEFFLYIAEDAKKKGMPVSGIQFIQNGISDLTVRLSCKDEVFSPVSTYITKRLKDEFDSEASVNFERVSTIEREPSGKLRVVKRNYKIEV